MTQVASASKKDTSKLLAYKYDYLVSGTYSGGEVCGAQSKIIADAIGLKAAFNVSGSVLYNGNNHDMSVSAGGGVLNATAYLTSNALYGKGYSYDYYYNKFNAYRLTLSVSYTCTETGVSFAPLSVELNGNF